MLRYPAGMEGITSLLVERGPILIWDTTRYSYSDDPKTHARRLREVIEERESEHLVVFCPYDDLEIVKEITWIMELFGFHAYAFVMSGPSPLPIYRKETLEGKWIDNRKRPWVPLEMLSIAVESVSLEGKPGFYPFMGVPFQLSTLARALGLPGKAYEERARAVQWANVPHSIKTLNENAFSYEAQLAFWKAYTAKVEPFSPRSD